MYTVYFYICFQNISYYLDLSLLYLGKAAEKSTNTLTNLHANLIQCRCRQILQGCWFRNRSLSVTVCLSGCLLLAAKQLQVFKVLHACHHTVYLHSVVWLLLQIPFICVLFKVTKEARSNV